MLIQVGDTITHKTWSSEYEVLKVHENKYVIKNLLTQEVIFWTPHENFVPDTIIPKSSRIERKIALMYERFERRHK
jgi:hypothetical protein